MRTKLCEVSVFDNGAELETDIGEQAPNESQLLWWLVLINLRTTLEIERIFRRLGTDAGVFPPTH